MNNNFSIENLYEKVNGILSSNLSLLRGLTLTQVSIDRKLEINPQWNYSYFTGTSKNPNKKNYKITLKIEKNILIEYAKKNGNILPENASYDILIDNIEISSRGEISITVGHLNETGISEREMLKRRLEKFCKDTGYDKRLKKPLPKIITNILAITSQHSNIHDDLISNINIPKEKILVVNCKNSYEIANEIKKASSNYDIIVLYRGGREDDAMNIFSHEEIIKSIDSSSIPVCAALGHDTDIPFIYNIADHTYSTPSAFGKEITIHNNRVKTELINLMNDIAIVLKNIENKIHNNHNIILNNINIVSDSLQEKIIANIEKYLEEIESSISRIKDKAMYKIEVLDIKIKNSVKNINQKHKTNQELLHKQKLIKKQKKKNMFLIILILILFVSLILIMFLR